MHRGRDLCRIPFEFQGSSTKIKRKLQFYIGFNVCIVLNFWGIYERKIQTAMQRKTEQKSRMLHRFSDSEDTTGVLWV